MKLCSINPSDLITIRGAYSNRIGLPNIAGFEGIGTVVAVGSYVKHIHLGSRVLHLMRQGAWQEYTIIPANTAILVPDAIEDCIAAQLYINPLTAWVMLKEKLKVQKGDTIAVNAGNSAFGYTVVMFSQFFSINIISIVRRSSCIENLKKSGAKFIINTSDTNLKNAIASYTKGKGVKFALDAVGGEDGSSLADCVQNHGKMLHYGLLSGRQLPEDVYVRSAIRNVSIENYFLRDWVYNQEPISYQNTFKDIMEVFIKLNIQLPIECEYQFEKVAEAVKHAEMPGRNGKVLLKFF